MKIRIFMLSLLSGINAYASQPIRIHALIHAPFEKPGFITQWAEKNGFPITETHTYRGENLPDIKSFDFLIVMGGPQSSCTLEKYPYLADEVLLIQEALAEKKHILGFCLGAQLIGLACGSIPSKSPEKEVGVFPILLTEHAQDDPVFSLLPQSFDVMHWHNDMPGILDNQSLLATSEGCPRQAVKFAERAYGLQFHLEHTSELLEEMIHACPEDLAPSQFTQSAETIRNANCSLMNSYLAIILNALTKI